MRIFLTILLLLSLVGCDNDAASGGDTLVLYTSVDEPYARPIVDKFTQQTGIKVRLVTDTEATKSVGLAERLRIEKDRPVADVWWGNEPFHTVRLARENAFAAYEPSTAADTLPLYRDAEERWTGNGLRARVVAIFQTTADPNDPVPALAVPGNSLIDFAEWLDDDDVYEAAIARPTAGTTGGHVAALYTLWGQEKADAWFRSLHDGGVTVVAGNGPAARFVDGWGKYALTDNDDVANFNKNSDSPQLQAVLPDQEDGQMGTLTIPTTVALVAKDQPSDAAKRLVDFLASVEVERMLAEAEFTIGSVRQSPESGGIRAMDVDYDAVADAMPEAVRRATVLLEGREP